MIFEPLPSEWERVPEHMREGIRNYVYHGIPGGNFLDACLRNDLRRACQGADSINAYAIANIIRFFDMHLPRYSYGSDEAVNKWLEMKGLNGIIGQRGEVKDDNDIDKDIQF